MIYLKEFNLLSDEEELGITDPRRINNNTYPVGFFSGKKFHDITFAPITIFAGSNGCGKSTLLNIIAEKLEAKRLTPFNKGVNFANYVRCCNLDKAYEDPLEISTITSDDVFDYLLDIRAINSSVARKKEELSKSWLQNRFSDHKTSFDSYEELKDDYEATHNSMSKYIRQRLANNTIIEQSNGESSLMFWEKEIKEDSIYLLDEPENSLSAENQLKLKTFIEESVRFYNCQFIISTHSPFLLALNDAKIYNLDETPVKVSTWHNLPNVRLYYDFFKSHDDEFKN